VATKIKPETELLTDAEREAEAELDAELEAERETERLGWIDSIIKKAGLPQLTDLGGALIAYNNLTCSDASTHTFRRLPIPYFIIGRERRYRVDDVIAFAREQLKTPLRKPAGRRPWRRKDINAVA
jgi:hypothetical protein